MKRLSFLSLIIISVSCFFLVSENHRVEVSARTINFVAGDDESPQVNDIEPLFLRQEGSTVKIQGRNFSPDTIVTLDLKKLADVEITPTEITFKSPPQHFPGAILLSIQTSKGIVQKELAVIAKPLDELNKGEITTIAGVKPFLGTGGKATNASLLLGVTGVFGRRFFIEGSIIVDKQGNLYISDSGHNAIRKVSPKGTITDLLYSIASPTSTYLDENDNLFYVTTSGFINKINLNTREVSTVAGSIKGEFEDGHLARETVLDRVGGIVVDKKGNLYFADYFANRVRVVDAKTNIISTLVGGGELMSDNVPANMYKLFSPISVALDNRNNLYVVERNRVICIDLETKILKTIAGNRSSGFGGDGGLAVNAQIQTNGVFVDSLGNVFIADTGNHRIRRVDTRGIITTIAGNGIPEFSGDGGLAINASLRFPENIFCDEQGNIFINDSQNNRIRKISKDGIINTVAGNGKTFVIENNLPLNYSSIILPMGIGVDKQSNIIFSDGNQIRRVDAKTGNCQFIAGTGLQGFDGDGKLAIDAKLNLGFIGTGGLVLDRQGNIFFIDRENQRIRRIDAKTNIITTVAGDGTKASRGDDGLAVKASLNNPCGIALDRLGNIFISEIGGDRIRKINVETKIITTVVTASKPAGIAVDNEGNIFFKEQLTGQIKKFDRFKVITVVASHKEFFSSIAEALILDKSGKNLYLTGSSKIFKINLISGEVASIAGVSSIGFGGDGGLATKAALSFPIGIALDNLGNLLVADGSNRAIRIIKGVTKAKGRQL